ncbi:hypothetical protein HMPREF0369_00494 [Anaerostipes hadrus ATCC 29173 = JCM 17467]|nr:hypothetical protein HMPREF0369_00494 [Anaerostipes hadrus ATCC 29173 = JCM 17467]
MYKKTKKYIVYTIPDQNKRSGIFYPRKIRWNPLCNKKLAAPKKKNIEKDQGFLT